MARKPGKPAGEYNSAEDKKALDRYFGSDLTDAKQEWTKKVKRWDKNYAIVDFNFQKDTGTAPKSLPIWDSGRPIDEPSSGSGHRALVETDKKSHLKIPKAYQHKQLILTKLKNRECKIFPKALDPRYVDNQKAIGRIMQWVMEEGDFNKAYRDVCEYVAVYGNAFMKQVVAYEKRTISEIDEEELRALAREQGVSPLSILDIPTNEKEIEGWKIKFLAKSPKQIIPYPARSFDECTRVYERNKFPLSQFHELFDAYYPKARFVGAGPTDGEDKRKETDGDSESLHEGYVIVEEVWDSVQDRWLVKAGEVLLTKPDNPNPYNHKRLLDNKGGLPYSHFGYEKVSADDFWYKAPAEIVEHILREENTQRRLRIDNLTKLMKPQTLFNDAYIDPDDFDAERIPVNLPPGRDMREVIMELQRQGIKPESFTESSQLNQEALEVLGVNDASGQQYVSATGVGSADQKVNDRNQLIIEDWKEGPLRRQATLLFSNIVQFYGKDPEEVQKIIGEDELDRLLIQNGFADPETGEWKLTEEELYAKNILEIDYNEDGEREQKFNVWKWIPYENEKGQREFDLLSPDICKGKYKFDIELEPLVAKPMEQQQTMAMVQFVATLLGQFPELKEDVNIHKLLEWGVEANNKNFEELKSESPGDTAGEREALREEDKFRGGYWEPADRQASLAHVATHDKMYAETLQILESQFPELVDKYLKHIADEKEIAGRNSGRAAQPTPQPGAPQMPGQPGQPGPGELPPEVQEQLPQETLPGSQTPLGVEAQQLEQGGIPLG